MNAKWTLCLAVAFAQVSARAGTETSRLSDESVPLQIDSMPERPAPLLELGDPLLGTGKLYPGLAMPTGAVWQPSFMVWGTLRTALQANDDGTEPTSEWASRLDLFGNLYLTPTERILVGFRPLDEGGNFTRYTFEGADEGEFTDEFNFELVTLFFEGDFGELFPALDPSDRLGLDVGFSVGRQPIRFQDGMLIDDNLDALGVSKINLRPGSAINMRSTLLWSWSEINRQNLSSDDDTAILIGLFNEMDLRFSTIAVDAVYVDADDETGDALSLGLSSTQRMGLFNSTLRFLASSTIGEETDQNAGGFLLYHELSRTVHGSEDFTYLNLFVGVDEFRSASRGPVSGGPLGPVGVLFASVGLGNYGAALSSSPDNAYGGAIGHQIFFDGTRKHLLLEVGGRATTEDTGQESVAAGASFQMAIGRRSALRLDGYVSYGKEQETETTTSNELGIGGRIELNHRF